MATGTKLVKEITDQFLHCKICYEPYKEPKTLVCLHTFCTDCIQKHVDSDTNRSSRFLLYSRYITCPLCRSKTEIPTGGVRRLPDNFLLSSLTDVLDRKRVCKVPPCEICPGDQRPRNNNNASHKCLDCAKLLCKSCVDLHMTTKVTQEHSLIDIEGEKDIECKKHPEEIVRYYCEPCEECVCVVCTFQEHRDHEICSFSDGFGKYRSGLDALLSQCKDRLTDVQDRLSTINKVEGSLKETRENIRDLAISYIAQVRATERHLVQRVEDEFGSKVQGFLQNKEWLQENLENLQSTCNLAEIIMGDRGIEMLLLKKELQTKLSTLLEPAIPFAPENLSHNIKFIPGNVKLGDISLKPEDEADGDRDGGSVKKVDTVNTKHRLNDEDGDQPKKRPCITRDTQTDTNNSIMPPITAEMSFDVPTTIFSHGTFRANGLGKEHSLSSIDNNAVVSKTDVSVNTMCSMTDSKNSLLDDDSLSGVCVKCCAEYKKDHHSSTGSLPIVDGNAPVIQDIIITNSGDDKDRRRRRRSLIKSRRTQTDLTLSNESIDDVFSPLRSSQESLNGSFRKHSSQNLLTAVAESVITCSIGLDPIDFLSDYKTQKRMRNKGVNTTENVKVVADTRSIKTNTVTPDMRESTTMTYPSCRTTDTQTATKTQVNKLIATDYTGQRNKRTSTPIIITTDNSTYMPTIVQESKVTWTDLVQTTERAICTDTSETVESFTETMKPILCDQGIGVKPEMKTVETNTEPAAESTSGVKEKERKPKSKDKDKEKKDKTLEKKKRDKKERKEKKKYADSCVETDPVIHNDKQTGTARVQQKDSWTATVSPQLVNTGITPDRPATREAAIATNPVTLMDQATHTNIIKLQDNTTETIVVVCDSETLTERIGQQDAQTCVDVFSESVETSTDACHVVATGCNTDAEWIDESEREVNVVICELCQEKRSFVDSSTSPIDSVELENSIKPGKLVNSETQTAVIEIYDKSIATSCDFEDISDGFKGIEFNDMSTSTENLPYIGLLSDIDCDELILVPEIAIDVIGSDLEYEKIMKDSFPVQVREASAQTIISSASLNSDAMMDSETYFGQDLFDNLVTVGVNTDHKLTFEKETCTLSYHHFSKATNTQHIEKIDKSTTTGSFVRAMQETFGQSPAPERSSKVFKPIKKDVSIETDSTLLDEKMITCINKLKTVSERLNSPTSKTSPESPWSKQIDSNDGSSDALLKDLEKVSESERKKTVMDLVAKSKAITKPKETKTEPVRRKAQPLTTLKGKYTEKLTDQDVPNSPNLQRQSPPDSNTQSLKTGNSSTAKRVVPNSRRNNSAPPRIATVANQGALRKSPKPAPKTPTNGIISKSQGKSKQDQNADTLPSPKHDQGPEFYSTVPQKRHPKQGLPIISESRPSSTGSEISNTSFRSAKSEQHRGSSSSTDTPLDFSSLKITAQPRAPSVSPTPPRHATNQNASKKATPDQNTRTPRSATKPKIEVIPRIDVPEPDLETRVRTGSTSSDQTDAEPSPEKKGFMKKLFGSKKKKNLDKRTSSPSKSPKPGRKALETVPQPPPVHEEKPKEKPKAFVYMRSRIFSIEQKDDNKYNKPIVNKYCMNQEHEEKPPVFDFAATFTKKK